MDDAPLPAPVDFLVLVDELGLGLAGLARDPSREDRWYLLISELLGDQHCRYLPAELTVMEARREAEETVRRLQASRARST